MSEPTEDILAKEIRERVFRAAEDSIEFSTAPIGHFDRDQCIEIRTGIFLAIADSKFLVTAGHGMVEFSQKHVVSAILMPVKGLPPIPLLKDQILSTVSEKEDLSVIHLTESTVTAIGDHYRFLRITDLMLHNDPRQLQGIYLLIGFPRDMIKTESDAKACPTWKYLTTPYGRSLGNVENYDSHLHLVLDYERRAHNREGRTIHPHGMSGCGIWFVENPLSNTAVNLKLAGIQNGWFKKFEYVKGTWIDLVLLIIWKYFPETRASMGIHGVRF